ncbi:MAG TPA: hypothetical protein PKA95_07785 [Thermomicrobiales bacterium]|nr:hypothetical protein [Thermomicrobiales bacterium]
MSDQTPEMSPQGDDGTRRHRPRRRWLTIVSLALVVGALAIGGSVAAESGSSTTGEGLRESFLSRLASNLGISRDTLDQAITTAGNETIDEAVSNGDLTQQQGDALKQRVADGNIFGFGQRHGRIGRALFGHGDGMATIASTLGITTDELRAELQSGATLAEVITNHGSTVDAVVQALVAEAKVDLDQAVANGRLTQSQADEILSALPDRLTQAIENASPGWYGPWGGHETNPNDAPPEPTPQATPPL